MKKLNKTLVETRRLLFLARHPYLDIYHLDGDFNGTQLQMLIADDGSTLQYIKSLAFDDNVKVSLKGRISAFRAHRLSNSSADLVVVGANCLLTNLYAKHRFHIIPKWLCPVFSTAEHPDSSIEKLCKSAKKDIKRNLVKASKGEFDWELVSDQKWFDHFYRDMYRPFAEQKYGEMVQLDSYSRVKRAFDQGVGIKVIQNGIEVGGTLVYIKNRTMRNPYMGIINGDDSIGRSGVSRLLYYYVMQLAHSWNCDAVNFGSSRPFISDGVLNYKLKWGMDVVQDELSSAAFALIAPNHTPAAMQFMSTHPFFELIDDSLKLHHPNIKMCD